MDWTRDQKLQALMRLPWTVRSERNDEEAYFVARVIEVPDAIATSANERELAKDLWESLCQSLAVRLDHGDAIPLPVGKHLPWERGHEPPKRRILAVKYHGAKSAEVRDATYGGVVQL